MLLWFVGAVLSAMPAVSVAQSSAPSLLLAVCGGGGCSRWEFHGEQATVAWPGGATSKVPIKQFPKTETGDVLFESVDISGSVAGFAGTYAGARKGPVLEGKTTWKLNGTPKGSEADWVGVVLSDAVHMVPTAAHPLKPIPSSLTICEDGRGCSVWNFNGKVGAIPGIANLSVERFDDSLIAIRRNEIAGALKGLEALYVGICNDNEVKGVAVWKWAGQPPVGAIGWHTTLFAGNSPTKSVAQSGPPPAVPIEKIVDVVKPVEALKDQPPPAAPWNPKKTIAAFDLNGTWELQSGGQSEKISVHQLRDHLTATIIATNLPERRHFLPGAIVFQAAFSSSNSAVGQIEVEDLDDFKVADGFDGVITSARPDEFQVSMSLGGKHINDLHYRRIAAAPVEEIPCELSNPHNIFRDAALQRGDVYLLDHDAVTANCWLYVAAVDGNGDARAEYGRSLHDGRGLPQNVALGIDWIQQAAVLGSVRASQYMSAFFIGGGGLPASKQRRDYWMARYLGMSPTMLHDNQHHSRWDWMDDTSPACVPANPKHVNSGDALKMGRVAYEARSFHLAHCWLRISAEQGEMTAWAYLGLMSAFGMGVEANRHNGFDYTYHAAREKNVYAMVYLAEFYRYGVGVEPNDAQAREIMNAATSRPGGEDAFEHAEGTFRSPSQGFAMLGNLFAASVATDMECPETPAHYEIHGQQRVWVEASRAAGCKTPEADAILDRIDIAGPNTLSTPEELYPENPFHSF